jgi:hypothetical protein
MEVKALYKDAAETAVNEAWATALTSVFSNDFSELGAYVNYIDPRLSGWQRAYYGDNYARLQRIKAAVDGEGRFAFAQGIQPSSVPAASSPSASSSSFMDGLIAKHSASKCFPTARLVRLHESDDMHSSQSTVVVAVPPRVLAAFVQRVDLWPLWNADVSHGDSTAPLRACDPLAATFTTRFAVTPPPHAHFPPPIVVVNTLPLKEAHDASSADGDSGDESYTLGWTFAQTAPSTEKKNAVEKTVTSGAHFMSFAAVTTTTTVNNDNDDDDDAAEIAVSVSSSSASTASSTPLPPATLFTTWEKISGAVVRENRGAFEGGLHTQV